MLLLQRLFETAKLDRVLERPCAVAHPLIFSFRLHALRTIYIGCLPCREAERAELVKVHYQHRADGGVEHHDPDDPGGILVPLLLLLVGEYHLECPHEYIGSYSKKYIVHRLPPFLKGYLVLRMRRPSPSIARSISRWRPSHSRP
jgi:hypothetical protein